MKFSHICTALMISNSFAHAADPDSLQDFSHLKVATHKGLPEGNFHAYRFEETVLHGGRTITPRVFVDKAVGVTCQWMEEGRRVRNEQAEFITEDTVVKPSQCSSGVTLADSRFAFRSQQATANGGFMSQSASDGATVDQTIDVGDVKMSARYLGNIIEIVRGHHAHALEDFRILHRWNVAANQVCLTTFEIPEDSSGITGELKPQDWGCFEITNKAYYDQILKAAGVSPS